MNSSWYQEAFGAHYPVLYAHRDEAEAERCLDLLPRLAPLSGPEGRPILDLGCGDGRHLARLIQGGYRAVGLDLSAALLEVARTRRRAGVALPLVRGDMRLLPFADASFDSVLSLFTAFGYFSTDEDNQLPVNDISRVLVPAGHWFLDYLDADAVRAELGDGRPRSRCREADCLSVEETRSLSRDGRRVVKRVVLRPRPGEERAAAGLGVGPQGLRYEESVALFAHGELDAMARRAGLEPVAAAGGYEEQPIGEGNRWILVYRKIPEGDRS